MITALTNQECVVSVLRSVDHWIAKGLNYKDAITVTAELREVDYDKIEHFWIEREILRATEEF